MTDEPERISYADYSVIDEYIKLKRDSDEIFRQHNEQLMEQKRRVEHLQNEAAKKDGMIDQLQQQLVKTKHELEELKNEKNRQIQELQMQVQNLNSRLAGFQRRG